jgi:hypothetical protein
MLLLCRWPWLLWERLMPLPAPTAAAAACLLPAT